jgi:hypothetical protein
MWKISEYCKLSNTLLNDLWVKKEITEEIRKYFNCLTTTTTTTTKEKPRHIPKSVESI